MRTGYERNVGVGLLAAVASVAAITLAIYGLRELVPVVSTGVVYMLAVLLVSSGWGLWLGLVTGLLSAATFNFFHIPPTGEFTIADGENWVALAVFLVAAAVTSTLADAARSRAADAERDRAEADLTAEMARLLLGGESLEGSLNTVGQRIAQTFGLQSVAVEPSWVGAGERQRALPLVVEGSRVGTILIPADTGDAVLHALEDRVVPALETLLAAARSRDELEAQVIETKALRRANVVKTTLLRSVSHDLRSPLTAIATAAGGLESETISDEQRRELASVITEETARLERLIRNLLDLSRLQAGGAEPRTDWALARRAGARRGRLGRRTARHLRPRPRPRPAAAPRGRRAARARARERARELRPLRGRRARDGPRPRDRPRTSCCGSPTTGPAFRARTWSGSSSRSTASTTATAAPGSGSRSRAGSSRRTAAASAPSRCRARARASSSSSGPRWRRPGRRAGGRGERASPGARLRRRAPDPARAAGDPARRRLRGGDGRDRAGGARQCGGRARGRGDPRPGASRRQRGRRVPLDPGVERHADHRAVRGRRGGAEGARARGGRRRLRDEAVRPGRARRPPARGAPPGRRRHARRADAPR